MAKRLVRAKQKIRNAGDPVPGAGPAHLLPRADDGVLGVLYLLFAEGYSATAGAGPDPGRPVRRGDPAGADRPGADAGRAGGPRRCWR